MCISSNICLLLWTICVHALFKPMIDTAAIFELFKIIYSVYISLKQILMVNNIVVLGDVYLHISHCNINLYQNLQQRVL